MREMPGKPLISVIHIFPTPVILADVTGLDGISLRGHNARLAGTRHASFLVLYFLSSSDDQPRNSLAGDFVTSHKAY